MLVGFHCPVDNRFYDRHGGLDDCCTSWIDALVHCRSDNLPLNQRASDYRSVALNEMWRRVIDWWRSNELRVHGRICTLAVMDDKRRRRADDVGVLFFSVSGDVLER